MRSKEAFTYSRSTGYFCSVAASTVRVSGSSKRPGPPSVRCDGPGLANVSGTELTDGWVRPETYVPHWDPPQAPSFRTGAFLLVHGTGHILGWRPRPAAFRNECLMLA